MACHSLATTASLPALLRLVSASELLAALSADATCDWLHPTVTALAERVASATATSIASKGASGGAGGSDSDSDSSDDDSDGDTAAAATAGPSTLQLQLLASCIATVLSVIGQQGTVDARAAVRDAVRGLAGNAVGNGELSLSWLQPLLTSAA